MRDIDLAARCLPTIPPVSPTATPIPTNTPRATASALPSPTPEFARPTPSQTAITGDCYALTRVAFRGVNIRSRASTGAEIIGFLSVGDIVAIERISGDWGEIGAVVSGANASLGWVFWGAGWFAPSACIAPLSLAPLGFPVPTTSGHAIPSPAATLGFVPPLP